MVLFFAVLEYVGPKWRTFVANMSIAIFFTIASCSLPWIAYYLGDWKMFTIVTSAPLCLAILTPFIVPESARSDLPLHSISTCPIIKCLYLLLFFSVSRWLVSQGKIEKAIKILKKFEKINGKDVEPQIYKDFSVS